MSSWATRSSSLFFKQKFHCLGSVYVCDGKSRLCEKSWNVFIFWQAENKRHSHVPLRSIFLHPRKLESIASFVIVSGGKRRVLDVHSSWSACSLRHCRYKKEVIFLHNWYRDDLVVPWCPGVGCPRLSNGKMKDERKQWWGGVLLHLASTYVKCTCGVHWLAPDPPWG